MKELCERYTRQLAEVRVLARPRFSPEMTKEGILERIRRDSRRIFELRQDNDRLLYQLLFSRKPEDLTAEEAKELEDFAGELSYYNRRTDVGVAYYIHKLLYGYAQLHGDDALSVRALYNLGLCLHYMNQREARAGVNLYGNQVSEYFARGAAYLERYEEMDTATRGYIVRCLGNRRLDMESLCGPNNGVIQEFEQADTYPIYLKLFNEAMDVIRSPKYRAMDPDLPWHAYEYTMHFDRCRFVSAQRRDWGSGLAQDLLESAEFIYRDQEQLARMKDRVVGYQAKYYYLAARYQAGLIPCRELVETLLDWCESCDRSDFTGEGLYGNVMLPVYADLFAGDLSEEERAELAPRLERAMDSQLAYLLSLPQNDYGAMMADELHRFAPYRLGKDRKDLEAHILDYLMACHQPTYVHSRVVSHLTERLVRRMIQTDPENLVGVLGTKSPEEVRAREEELCLHAAQCGLYHDMGKNMVLDDVAIYGRKLLDEEYNCIREHPWMGYYLLTAVEGFRDQAMVALHHHRHYNGTGGYPLNCIACEPSIRPVVDIVAVADAMDAGTDNIGRSYAQTKTFESLVEELRRWSGERYSPAVVRLLDDEAFFQDLAEDLKRAREQIYYEIYPAPAEKK